MFDTHKNYDYHVTDVFVERTPLFLTLSGTDTEL